MTDASGSTTWSYDERGRMTGEAKTIGGNTYTTAWEYNLADLPIAQTYPDSEVVTSSYTPQLTLDTLSGLEPYISNTAYDSAGRMVARSLGNGVTQTHTYHPWSTDGGRLAGISAGTVQNLGYTYDDGGNILSIVDSIAGPQTQSFGYDALNRLTSADAVGGLDGLYAETYGYDGNTGNLAAKAGLTYTYGDSAHPHAVTGLSDGSTYTYDANGSMISRTRNGVTTTFTYNAENKLVRVQEGGNTIAQFSYDGDGNRVQSTINGVTTQFVGEYYEVSGTDVTKYYGGQTAMRVNGIISYLLADHLGSNALVLDSAGNVVGETRYKAWGEIRYASGSSTDYTYTGQYSNTSDFGWMFYKARWYDPLLGRFNQADTSIPSYNSGLEWDRYAYSYNNPVLFSDPNGHMPCEFWCPGDRLDSTEAIMGKYYVGDWDIEQQKRNAEVTEAVLTSAASLSYEPVDWALTALDCTEGKCSPWVALAALPLVSGAMANRIDDALDIAKKIDNAEDLSRVYTKNNFRNNVTRSLGISYDSVKGLDAHHIFPQQWEEIFLFRFDINIHEPKYGVMIERSAHKRFGFEYNLLWGDFLRNKNLTKAEVLEFGRKLGDLYGYKVHY